MRAVTWCGVVVAVLVATSSATAHAALDDRVAVVAATGSANEGPAIQTLQAVGAERRNPDLGRPLFDSLSPQRPLWSPDGRELAFVAGEYEYVGEYDSAELRGYSVRVVAQDGSSARLLTDGASGVDGGLTWTNDGSHVAYVAGPADDTRLGLVRRDGSARALLDIGRRDMTTLQWSPDGELVTFASETPDGAVGLFAVRPDGSGLRLLADKSGRSPLSWSPDGDRFVYLRNGPEIKDVVRVVRRDGTVERELGQGVQAVWSPDGETVAVSRDYFTGEVSLVDPDTGEERPLEARLPEDFVVMSVTSWSADSRHVTAQVRYDAPNSYFTSTWVIDVETGAAQQVESDAYVSKYGGYGLFSPLPTTPPPTRQTTAACPPDRVPSAGFTDTAGSSFVREIDCVAWYDVTRGTSADTYSPGSPVTRVQMAQFLTRLAERADVAVDTSDAGFTDLEGLSSAARDAVNAVANLGVARGASETRFVPQQLVTRAQMASFLARLHEALAGDPIDRRVHCFSDVSTSVHRAAIESLCGAGVAAGTAIASYAPAATVTRGQMAAFLTRLLDIEVDAGLVQTPSS